MPVYSIKGSVVRIGSAPMPLKAGDHVAADFTSVTWVVVGEPETLGSYGDEWATEDFTSVADGRTRTLADARKAQPVDLVFGLDPTDAGQLALRAAHATGNNFPIRLELADKPLTGASPKNSTRTFIGIVTKISDQAEKIGRFAVTVQPNSNYVTTHASPT